MPINDMTIACICDWDLYFFEKPSKVHVLTVCIFDK